MGIKNKSDIEFVLNERARFADMDREDFRNLNPQDVLSHIPGPGGFGWIVIGWAAMQRLYGMAERELETSNFRGRLSAQKIVSSLEQIISKRFLEERRELNEREADRAVSWAIKDASKCISDMTHFLPCHFGEFLTPDEFSIGPVKFLRRDIFEKKLLKFNKEASGKNGEETEDDKKRFLTATNYYKAFEWVAEVSISSCEPELSGVYAQKISQGAIDCVHLMLGSEFTKNSRLSGPEFSADRRGTIKAKDGHLQAGWSVNWKTRSFPQDWWSKWNEDGREDLLGLMGIALDQGYKVPSASPYSQRFTDALAWYGEAVRDHFYASQIVKYVTAMERILITEKNRDQSSVFTERGVALAYQFENQKLSELSAKFRRVYDLRSKLLHGYRSPFETGSRQNLVDAEKLTRSVMFGALLFYGERGLADETEDLGRTNDAFERLSNWVEDLDRKKSDPDG